MGFVAAAEILLVKHYSKTPSAMLMLVEMEARIPTAVFQKTVVIACVQTIFYLDTKINNSDHILMLSASI